jgi:exonuclease SbcC
MKILKLKSKNINSLKGENEIDFSHAHFQNRIFAIVGATGAGKSTLLDAISLALYAQTTRLKGDVAKIMSNSASDSFAEVTFEIKGRRYRSRFEQKKEGDGVVSTMYLFSGNSLLTKGIAKVCKKIEELIGVDFFQFRQSIVLSQGLFDTFLKAETKERMGLLERVTNTEIYAIISKDTFHRAKKEQESFERMESGLKNLVYLNPEVRKKLEQREAILENERKAFNLESLLNTYNEKIAFDKLQKESKRYKEELQRLQNILMGRQLEEKQYEDFMRFLVIEKKKIEQAKLFDHELTFNQKNLLKIEGEIKEAEQEIQAIEKYIEQNESELSKFRVRQTLLKKQLNAFNNMEHLQQNFTLISSKFNERLKYQDELKKFQETAYEELSDEPLVEKIVLLEHTVVELDQKIRAEKIEQVEQQNLILEKKIEKLLEKTRLEQSQAILSESKKRLDQGLTQGEEERDQLKKEQEEMRELIAQLEEKRHLEEKIINYERDRAELKDGVSCPLCGSTEHPLFSEKIEPNKTQEILDKKRVTYEELTVRLTESEKRLVKLQEEMKHLEEQVLSNKQNLVGLAELTGDVHLLREEQKRFKKKINSVKYQRDELELTRSRLVTSKEELTQLRMQIQKNNNRKKVEEELQLKLKELSYYLIKTLRTYNIELDAHSLNILEAKIKEYQHLSSELKTLLQEMNPLEGKKMQNISRKNYVEETLRSLRKRASMQECDILLVKQNRVAVMGDKGTASYNEELNLKNQKQQESYNDFKKLKSQFRQQQKRYLAAMEELERKQKLKMVSLAELEKEKNRVQLKTDSINQELGAIKAKLEQDDENIKKRNREKNSLEEQEVIAKEWQALNEVIGSEDGSKYQIYVQNLTLVELITLANGYLEKLNHRYLLSLKEGNSLDIEVTDKELDDSRRGVETLSGGESFIVSLALSLALLEMNSEQIEINTLFLDEGFETLDEESLTMVIETLTNLEIRGKIIGVISHVPLLKEAIKTQVQIEKRGSGISSLSVVS